VKKNKKKGQSLLPASDVLKSGLSSGACRLLTKKRMRGRYFGMILEEAEKKGT